jgi:glycosyltransferase involved in cell wall biosynthesis
VRFAYLSCDFGVRAFGGAGSSVHLRETVGALRGLGHEVDVFAPDLGLSEGEPEPSGFHALPLSGLAGETARWLGRERTGRSDHIVREWRRIMYSEYVQRAVRERFEARPPDVIYERYSLFAYAGLELAQSFGCPLLLEVNAPLSQEATRYRELVLRRTAEALEARIFQGADALFVVSDELASHARQLGASSRRVHVLPNGVDPERFHPRASGGALRSRLALEGARVVGFVGGLRPWHDLDTVVEAVRSLAQEDPRVRLLVIGEGPRLEALRALGDERVVCPGAVAFEDVPAALAAMDVVVVPYAKDGASYFSPLKLFEAMAVARPVVGARVGQVAEVLHHGETGLLYEPGQARDLAARIRSLLDQPDWGAGLGAAARDLVLRERSWAANGRRIVDCAEACRANPRTEACA